MLYDHALVARALAGENTLRPGLQDDRQSRGLPAAGPLARLDPTACEDWIARLLQDTLFG